MHLLNSSRDQTKGTGLTKEFERPFLSHPCRDGGRNETNSTRRGCTERHGKRKDLRIGFGYVESPTCARSFPCVSLVPSQLEQRLKTEYTLLPYSSPNSPLAELFRLALSPTLPQNVIISSNTRQLINRRSGSGFADYTPVHPTKSTLQPAFTFAIIPVKNWAISSFEQPKGRPRNRMKQSSSVEDVALVEGPERFTIHSISDFLERNTKKESCN